MSVGGLTPCRHRGPYSWRKYKDVKYEDKEKFKEKIYIMIQCLKSRFYFVYIFMCYSLYEPI